ncbi:MAG: CBS domain-containing protein [Omnitrophica WOR_2 bacterium]
MVANISIHELLKSKDSDEIISVSPQTSVFEALQKMAEKNIGALLVIENDKLVGLFSERDYARKIILKGKSSLDTPVSEIMTREPILVTPAHTVEECMVLMNKNHIRHLPVIDKEKVVGMVSMRDLVQMIISGQKRRIETLENYIEGHEYGH